MISGVCISSSATAFPAQVCCGRTHVKVRRNLRNQIAEPHDWPSGEAHGPHHICYQIVTPAALRTFHISQINSGFLRRVVRTIHASRLRRAQHRCGGRFVTDKEIIFYCLQNTKHNTVVPQARNSGSANLTVATVDHRHPDVEHNGSFTPKGIPQMLPIPGFVLYRSFPLFP